MQNIKIIFSTLCLLCANFFAQAQQPDLDVEEVEIIKDFEARLVDSERLNLNPELPPADTSSKRLTYNIPTQLLTLEYLPPSIRPIAMRSKKPTPGYKGYAKLGYGFPSSPYGELGYNFGDSKRYNLGVNLKHHSASFNDIENQRFAETMGKLSGNYYSDLGFAVSGYLGFTNDVVHYYGYDQEANSFTKEQVQQKFNTFEIGTKIYNAQRTQGDINYSAGVDFYRTNDNYGTTENGFDLLLGATKWISEKHPIDVELGTEFTYFQDTLDQTLHNFYLKPTFTYHGDSYKVMGGINILSSDDEYSFFPLIEASVNILENKLAVFAGWKGDFEKNNLRNLSDYNPFMQTRFELRNTSYQHFYGGVRGNVRIFEYQGQIGYKQATDLALFKTDSLDVLNRLNVVYDTVDIFNIQGTIGINAMKNLSVLMTIGQNVYSLQTEEKAWHLPALEINISATYTLLEDKLQLRGEAFIENGVPYIAAGGNAETLNSLFDISLGAEYFVTKNIGVFLNVNNLAANKRQRWFNYPTYGFNVLGGVTARF